MGIHWPVRIVSMMDEGLLDISLTWPFAYTGVGRRPFRQHDLAEINLNASSKKILYSNKAAVVSLLTKD